MVKHLLCAAFELPFRDGETYGNFGDVDELLEYLAEEGVLHHTRNQYHWLGDGTPSSRVSLRTNGDETVVIHDAENMLM